MSDAANIDNAVDKIRDQLPTIPSTESIKETAAKQLDAATHQASATAKNVEDIVRSGSEALDKNLQKVSDSIDTGLGALDKWLSKF
jgi:hypothetical protein